MQEPLSRELIEEVGWWVRNGARMRGDEWLTPHSQSFPAPPAQAETPKPPAAELLTTADTQREEGDATGAVRSIGGALAIEVDVPGGIERLRGIAPVLERARQLVSPVAREPRQTGPEERAVLEQFDERWHIGDRLAAVLELRAFTGTAIASGLAVERLLVAERALSLGRRERVELGGEEITVVFGGVSWLGRSDADIEVRSPLVSRQHLLFAASEAGPVARDDASANGTFFGAAGPRLELRIGRRCELRLGGEIELAIEPIGSRGQHLRVQGPATTTLLALGESLELAKIALRRWQSGDLAGWRFEAPSGEATLNGAPCDGAELARGDRIQCAGVDLVIGSRPQRAE